MHLHQFGIIFVEEYEMKCSVHLYIALTDALSGTNMETKWNWMFHLCQKVLFLHHLWVSTIYAWNLHISSTRLKVTRKKFLEQLHVMACLIIHYNSENKLFKNLFVSYDSHCQSCTVKVTPHLYLLRHKIRHSAEFISTSERAKPFSISLFLSTAIYI